jgi:hypothetical protein
VIASVASHVGVAIGFVIIGGFVVYISMIIAFMNAFRR